MASIRTGKSVRGKGTASGAKSKKPAAAKMAKSSSAKSPKASAASKKQAKAPAAKRKTTAQPTKKISDKKVAPSKRAKTQRAGAQVVSKPKVTKSTPKKADGKGKGSRVAQPKLSRKKGAVEKATKGVRKPAVPAKRAKTDSAASKTGHARKAETKTKRVAKSTPAQVPIKSERRSKGSAQEASPKATKSASSTSRRPKDKEKASAKSPFSHTDHASIFRAVEARKAAARAKQARMAPTHTKPKKTSSRRLTDKQLVEFEDMLVRIRAELLRQIAYLRGASLTRSDEVNPEEDGTDAFERQLALKLAAGEGDSIFEIDEAMERIREKTYGVCEECDCIIPTPRLKALPFARRCVECQSQIELTPNLTDHRYY